MTNIDWMPAEELARRTHNSLRSLYNQHCTGKGPLCPILTKFGGKLGCWRADYKKWLSAQRRLPDAA